MESSALGVRPPPEAQGAGEPAPGQVNDLEDSKRIRIDLHLVRRELFKELVADREAFDALPLEEKQKVFALIEQRVADVAQGIRVLQKELASRAVDVQTQDTATAAAGGDRAVRCRDAADGSGAGSGAAAGFRADRRVPPASRPRRSRRRRRRYHRP